jgi:hypothetical protein
VLGGYTFPESFDRNAPITVHLQDLGIPHSCEVFDTFLDGEELILEEFDLSEENYEEDAADWSAK